MSLELATDEQRAGVLAHLRQLAGRGAIDRERFDVLTSVAADAVSVADLTDVMSRVPPLASMTPPGKQLTEPLELRTMTGSLKMAGRWQVGRTTNARAPLVRISAVAVTGSISLRRPKPPARRRWFRRGRDD